MKGGKSMKKMKKILSISLIAVLALGASLGFAGCGEAEESKEEVTITIAAAASLENGFTEELIPAFEEENPNIKVTGTYDASGKLQKQIEEGAEIDVFFSAANKQMDELIEKDMIDEDSRTPVVENEIVLIKAKDADLPDIEKYEDVVNADIIAIGDPASVPAGQYAQESLENLKLWDGVQAKEVSLGTNVTEVLNWVAEGSADVGIVYRSDAMSMEDKVVVIAAAPADSVSPAIYPIGIVTSSEKKEAAQAFIDFLKTEKAQEIFEKYGFKPVTD